MRSYRLIQGLLSEELTNYGGKYLQLDNAKLYDLPNHKPEVVIAAGGPMAARLAGEKGDGLVATAADKELISAYRDAGGKGPCYAEIGLCWGQSDEEARTTAHKYFRWSVGGWPVQAELPDTEAFAAASKCVTPDNVAEKIVCGPSVKRHVEAIQEFLDAGFDHIILTQIGPDQAGFVEFFQKELAPALAKNRAA